MGKLLRGVRAEWISFDDENWTLIGKDMDDYSMDLNPDTEVVKNVLGETSFNHNGFTPSSSIEYQARSEDAIYPHLQKIVDELRTDEESTTVSVIRATLDEEVVNSNTKTLTGKGYKVKAIIVPTNDGGGAAGYSIPFEYHENGARTQGTVSVTDRVPTFTETAIE